MPLLGFKMPPSSISASRMPHFGMRGHGWSDLVLIGLFSLAVAVGFALLARRTRAEVADDYDRGAPFLRPAAARRRVGDPIQPGRRFF